MAARGGKTWNDTLAGGSTGNDWLNTTGYLQEFGEIMNTLTALPHKLLLSLLHNV